MRLKDRVIAIEQAFDPSYGAASDAPARAGEKNPQQDMRPLRKKTLWAKTRPKPPKTSILQVAPMKRVVTAILQTPDTPTTPATMPDVELIYPKETVQQMAWDWMKSYRQGNVGVMHNEEPGSRDFDGENAVVVESYIAPCDMEINQRAVPEGSWVVSYKIEDDQLWQDIVDGKITGPSLTSRNYTLEEIA